MDSAKNKNYIKVCNEVDRYGKKEAGTGEHLMKFRHVVFKLSSGGARQILRLISTGGTQSR